MENIAASEESEMIYVTKHLGEAPTPELLHRFRCLVNSSGGSQDIAITWLHDSIRRDLRVHMEHRFYSQVKNRKTEIEQC